MIETPKRLDREPVPPTIVRIGESFTLFDPQRTQINPSASEAEWIQELYGEKRMLRIAKGHHSYFSRSLIKLDFKNDEEMTLPFRIDASPDFVSIRALGMTHSKENEQSGYRFTFEDVSSFEKRAAKIETTETSIEPGNSGETKEMADIEDYPLNLTVYSNSILPGNDLYPYFEDLLKLRLQITLPGGLLVEARPDAEDDTITFSSFYPVDTGPLHTQRLQRLTLASPGHDIFLPDDQNTLQEITGKFRIASDRELEYEAKKET